VQFLAQGEYNLNYLLDTTRGKFVLRVNTASQMQLKNQIAYEYQALELLHRSGVTPRPYYLDDSKEIIPFGLLIMEYLPGEPLNYRQDLQMAATTFAKIHRLQFKGAESDFLIKEEGPFSGIYKEAEILLDKYFQSPDANLHVKDMLEKVLLKAEERKKEEEYLLREPWLAVINTEVNSHNFIVNQYLQTCHLIDWEKPILGEPAQDLSMFLIATTTMWKRNQILSMEEEESFIRQYLKRLPACPHKSTLRSRVEMFKFFNYLRAISWCAMAWTEYVKPGRKLVNEDTFEKITTYISPDFIRKTFPQVFLCW
jgi:thiamine kinase-like enzyme